MKKILLLGDYSQFSYHSLHGVDDELKEILGGVYEVDVCVEYAHLTLEDFRKYDLLLDYIDGWNRCGSSELAAAMLAYVAQGGAVFALHNGVIKHSHSELDQLYGARQNSHPPREKLQYQYTAGYPAVVGLEPFELYEEPYMFIMDPVAEIMPFLSFHLGDKAYPAGWMRLYGKGRVAVLSPGHDGSVLKAAEGLRALILRLAQWCAGDI